MCGGGRNVCRGRVGVEERGQGCFLFSQLIDTLMSAVGFVVALKISGSLFPSKNNQKTTQPAESWELAAFLIHVSSLNIQYGVTGDKI